MLLQLLAEAPQIIVDTPTAAIIAGGITSAGGVIAGGFIKGSTIMARYLQRRDKVHDEAMATSMTKVLEIQRDTLNGLNCVVASVEKVTAVVAKLEKDFEADRRARKEGN